MLPYVMSRATVAALVLSVFISAIRIAPCAPTAALLADDEDGGGAPTVPPPHNGVFPIATLNNGLSLPLVGLGCASGVRRRHVVSALEAGYRHLDTAQAYVWGYREDEVGDALRDASGPGRADVFVQSKIHPEDLGYDATLRAFDGSLHRLGVSYVDSMLLHKPRCWEGACRRQPEGTWQDSWRALERLHDEGKVRSIGICDVNDRILDELMRMRIKPHIIQNWMDPFHQDKSFRERCKREGVQYQAYSTLGTQWAHHRGHGRNPVLHDPTLNAIADAHGRTVAQVVINWATRHGVAVVPASTNAERQRSNLSSFDFDLTDAEMAAIDALDGTLRAPGGEEENEGANPNEVSVVFENRGPVRLESYWTNSRKEEIHVGSIPADGGSLSLTSYHGHTFVFRDGTTGEVAGSHTVERSGGLRQRHVLFDADEL